jgi:UDP-N-acetyl-D-mannosaminuronic acid dehydrogenase
MRTTPILLAKHKSRMARTELTENPNVTPLLGAANDRTARRGPSCPHPRGREPARRAGWRLASFAVQRPVDVVVVGGCGHVGLPLGIAFANAGLRVRAFDVNPAAVDQASAGKLLFVEPGGEAALARAIADEAFRATTDPSVVAEAEHIVVVIGTPVDEHLNPDPQAVPQAIAQLAPHLRDGQLLVLRSTVYPGVTRLVEELIADLDLDIDVACCPERIAEGKAFEELYSLPQIVSGRTESGTKRAAQLFGHLTDNIVTTSPEEAELAKLFTNTWRYIKFAAANQFFMMANDFGVDFERVRRAITFDYPRAADMPGAGFAAGPCLFKDTMQLASFHKNNFLLGHSAMMVNEGLPLYIVGRLEQRYDLKTMTVGLLGMAFKAESDDIRSSLSYKLRRILRFKTKEVLCTDPYVTTDHDLLPLDDMLERADLLIVGAPHNAYRDLDVGDTPVIDVWNLFDRGVLV